MKTKTSIMFFSATALAVLWACSSKPQAVENTAALVPPPPDIEYDLPLIPDPPEPPGRFCLLGTTCLAMDPRPFEPCLLTVKDCKDKAAEPMLVGPPVSVLPAPLEASH